MGLESGTYIDSLVVTNPTTSDKRRQGDDHLRLIKSTLKNTFPNIAGAVTPTHTELNYVVGVTSALQTQIDGKADSSHEHSADDITSGLLPISRGGTNASTKATARDNLDLGTSNSPQFTGVNVGHASDSTITRLASGKIAIEGKPILSHNDGTFSSAHITVSTSGPSGGSNGDIHLEREA